MYSAGTVGRAALGKDMKVTASLTGVGIGRDSPVYACIWAVDPNLFGRDLVIGDSVRPVATRQAWAFNVIGTSTVGPADLQPGPMESLHLNENLVKEVFQDCLSDDKAEHLKDLHTFYHYVSQLQYPCKF